MWLKLHSLFIEKMRWIKDLWPEWQIEEEIGAGAFGTVYKIKKQDLSGTYYAALKVISFPQSNRELETLRNENMSDSQVLDYLKSIASRTAKECLVMEQLKGHTNIVSYEDHKILSYRGGTFWNVLIRMELLTPLGTYLKTHTMQEREVCKLGIDICNAISLLEKRGIIHRDIKPGNIYVSEDGNFKLGDFGLAKDSGVYTVRTSPRGTLNYMAPEVYKGKRYNNTIDIYSLGLIMYRLLNRGRGPFQPLPPEPLSIELQEQSNETRFNTKAIPRPINASSTMAEIILKACSFEPEERYQNASALIEALEKHMMITNRDDHSKKKTMKDFFEIAGDL